MGYYDEWKKRKSASLKQDSNDQKSYYDEWKKRKGDAASGDTSITIGDQTFTSKEDYQAYERENLTGYDSTYDRDYIDTLTDRWNAMMGSATPTSTLPAATDNPKMTAREDISPRKVMNDVVERPDDNVGGYVDGRYYSGQEYINVYRQRVFKKENDYRRYELGAVSNPWSSLYDPDFYKTAGAGAEDLDKSKINGSEHMTRDELATYSYYVAKDKQNGTDLAQEYLSTIQDYINMRKGEKIADSMGDTPILSKRLKQAYGLVAGLDQFWSGLKGHFADGYTATTAAQYANQAISEDLADNGLLYYNAKTGEWEAVKILGKSTAQIVHDSMTTTGNMLPSILASAAVTAVAPSAGAAVGAATLGFSAAGNARAEMLNRGYSKKQANTYATLIGLSEAGLSYVLSGIPGVRGTDGVFSTLAQKIAGKVDNAIARVAITLGGNMFDEALEEGLQEVLDAWFVSISTGTDWEAPDVDQVLYASLLGALSAAGFGGGNIVVSKAGDAIAQAKIDRAVGKTFVDENARGDVVGATVARGLDMSSDTEAYKLSEKMQRKVDAGKKVSDRSLGRLVSSMSESQIRTSIQEKLADTVSDKSKLGSTAKTVTDAILGREVSSREISNLAKDQAALDVVNGYLGTQLKVGDSVKAIKETISKASISSMQTEQGYVGAERQVQALIYGGILGIGGKGMSGLRSVLSHTSTSVDVSNLTQAYNAVYQAGKKGSDISAITNQYTSLLSPAQRGIAYQAGVMDGILEGVRKKNADGEVKVSNTNTETEVIEPNADGEIITPVKKTTAEQDAVVSAGKKLGVDVVIADIKKGGENIDGKWDGKTLYINPKPNSGNPYFVLLKHELTHFTQNSSKYESFLKSAVDSKEFISWLRKKGFKSKAAYIAQVTEDYKRVNKNLTPEQAQQEMIANFVGDVLFAKDSSLNRFVSELDPDHKRTFGDFVRDFITWIKKKLGTLTEVEELERKYAELFKDAKEVEARGFVAETKSSQFSFSPNLERDIDLVLNGIFNDKNNEVYIGETSNFMTNTIGAKALKVYMSASKIYSALLTEEEYNKNPRYKKQEHYHGIGKKDFIEILKKSEEPVIAFADAPDSNGNKRQNRIVLVTDKKILDVQSGKYEYAVVVESVDDPSWDKGKRVTANKAITVYPLSALEAAIIDAISNKRLLHITKKGENLSAGVRGAISHEAIQEDSLKKNIAYFWANVKWEKQKNKTFSTKEPELPSAFQLALEQAGYFDQYGHSKYMQESENSSQDKNGSVGDEINGEESSYSYTPPRTEAEMSTRELLANMLDSVAESEREKNLLAKYKGHLAKIEESRAEIARLREERKIADKAHKRLYTSQIEKLGKVIADSNNWLIKLEEMSTIKRLVAKEREAMRDQAHLAGQMAQGRRDATILRHANERAESERESHREELAEQRKEARQQIEDATLAGQIAQGRKDATVYKARLAKQAKRYQEARRRDVDGRHTTAVKHKISRVVKQLDSLLRHGNKERHVHVGLQDAVVSVLEIFDVNAERTQRYAKDIAALDERIAQLEATDPESIDLEALIALREKKQRNSQSLADKLEKMRRAYEDIHKGRVEDVSPYYREEAKAIESVVSDTIEKIGGVLYEDMSLEQLEAVYKMYRVVLTTVQNANKVFKGDKLADLAEDASAMELELLDIAKLNEERWEGADRAREFIWNELTPYYAMKRIGSDTLMEYYWELIRGQNVYARDIAEAKSFAEATRKKYGAGKWDLNKVYTIIDKDGRKFKLTLEHMMSIYAYSKRDQALDHMEKGGFFFNDKATFKKVGSVLKFIKANESGYKVDADVMAEILGTLDDIDENIVHYVDEMQDYLTKMGEKGNEVTRKMWGIDIFTEKVYFPLMSKEDFIYQANTPAETSSLKNDGVTKETKPHASNPIVLEAFDSVWDQHVEKMSKYHGFVIPIDNLNKLVNYSWMGGKDTQVKLSEKDKTEGKIAADFIAEVVQMQDKVRRSKRKKKIGLPSPAHIQKIESLMKTIKGDFSADGYEVWIDGTAADHIVRRHGENGVADHSMAERESRELIPWVINNPDSGEFIRNFDGTLDLSNRYFNADGSGAPQIRLEKQLDGDTVYVSECVPDSANKRIHITSAYIKKGSTDQLLNMDPTSGTPQPTSKTSFDGSTTNNSIAHQNKNVNKNFSPNSEMGSHSISTMLAARYSGAVNEYLTTFIKDLNGAKAQSGPVASFFTGLFSKFKKTSVAASLSVVVQQPTAILRALSEIDAKYFVGLPKSVSLNMRWELIQKYAPVAIIKDIGGFDAGSGRTATEWLGADTKRGIDKVMSKADDLTMYGAALGDRLGWGSIWVACEREVTATRDLAPGTEEFYEAVGERFTEVIVKTQVYDSTLSRSGFMRGKDGVMKMATAFMGEPTLSFNMIADAILQAKRGKITKKVAARTIGAVYASILAAAIAKSFIYALRDDDEDESYVEKLVQSFSGNIVNDINPLSMLPVFRDVVSIFDGWDVERSDMAIVQDFYNAITALDSDNKSVYRKIEDLAGATAAFAGVPAKNLLRTGREMYNLFENLFDDISGGNLGKAFKEGITGRQTSKSEALYDALVSGDTGRIEIYRESYDDESKYKTAVKKALRDYDPRVQRAVERALSGDYGTYNELKRAVRSEKKFDVDTVNNAFADEREYVLGKLKDARKARREGKMDEYNKIVDQLVKRGYSRSFINKKLK